MKIMKLVCAMLVALCFCVSAAHGNGYKLLNLKSAKSTSMGEAFITQADDPSAVAVNPAGLAQLRGNHVNLQVTYAKGYTTHTAPDGTETENIASWQPVPAFFACTDLGRDDLTIGLGVSLPNGLGSEWAKDSFARYVSTYSSLMVADISPAIGYRVSDRLLLGAGFDFYYSEAQLNRMVDLGLQFGAPGAMDAESTLTGTGSASGFNLGAICRITDSHSIALTYRRPYSIDYDGSLSIDEAGMNVDVTASIDFPAIVVLGYGYRASDDWKFEVNADWTDWASTGDIRIQSRTPGAMPEVTQSQNLKNTIAWKFGVEHIYSDTLKLRCGYIYNRNATPEATWRPSLPDADTHFVTAGLGYSSGNFTIDAALQLLAYETRTIDNDVDNNETTSSSSIDGTYRTWGSCASLSGTYSF